MSLPEKYDWKVSVPEGKSGLWSVECFEVTEADSRFDALRAINPSSFGRFTPAGHYTRLMRGGTVVMSDTPDEIRDHSYFVRRAQGRVLIAGLGLGVVLKALLAKPEVSSVDVVEQSEDVVKLVWPTYQADQRARLIQADILEWQPEKGQKWDHAWWDIWDNICSDNLKDMTKLNRRFARRVPNKGAWAQGQCQAARDRWRDSPWG